MRKFIRNKFALVALFVISVYMGVGIAVGFGIISEDEYNNRWGPDEMPGTLVSATLESRMSYCDWVLNLAEVALTDVDYDIERTERDLKAIDYFGLRASTSNPRIFADLFNDAADAYYELAEEIEDLEAPEDLDESAALAWEQQELASMIKSFDEIEPQVRSLLVLDAEKASMQSIALLMGLDRQGRSISLRGLYAIKIAIQIGLVAALVSVLIGTLLGGLAGFFGGWIDSFVVWLYSTFSAIPYIVLLMVLAAMFLNTPAENTLIPVYVAFCATFWIGPCRVIRGEVLKLREQEYVQAATAMGFGRMHILIKHILPNTIHLQFINFSLMFIGAIKAEVILSFLGLGVKDEPSWGRMISQSKAQVTSGFMWQIGTATVLMFCLVYAFNILSDALQDAFDPKHV